MQEVIGKRTRSSKTHSLGGGKYAWDGTIGSIHYEDNGWQGIDNIFEPAVAPWDWEMLKAGYHIRVKEDFTAGQIIEFEVQGETVQFQPMALEWTNDLDQIQPISMPQGASPVITNPEVDLLPAVGMPSHQGTIRWDDAYGQGIDFEWKCTPTRLSKTLEIENLNNLPVPEQYILDGGNPVLRLNLIFDPPTKRDVDIVVDGEVWNRTSKKQTFKMIEFRKDGEVLWGFIPLRYWGSNPESEDNEGQSVATLEKRGNKLYISIRVPYDWLQTTTYPIFIDTDIIPQPEQVGASSDDAYEKGDGAFDWASTYLEMRSDTNPLDYYYRCNGARFQTVSVPQGATIGTAYHEVYVPYTFLDDANGKIYAEAVDDAVNFGVNQDIIGRARTDGTGVDGDGYASWVEDSLGVGWRGSNISLTNVIQEIVNRPLWEANFDIVLLGIANTDTSKTLGPYSWDYDTSLAFKLHIEYEVGEPPAEGQPYISRVQGVQGMRSWGGI